jgi:hypothetical protein
LLRVRKELVGWVRKEISPIAAPDLIQFAPGLPNALGQDVRRLCKIAEDGSAISATPPRSPIRWWMIWSTTGRTSARS